MKTAALIVAAGRGTRARGPDPKQYATIGGVPVLARALRAFLAHPDIALVAVVIAREDEALYRAAVAGLTSGKLLGPVGGGPTRQASVGNGLRALCAHLPSEC